MRGTRITRLALLLLAVALIGGGCTSAKLPVAYNVTVALSDSLRDPAAALPGVDVFMQGISDEEFAQTWSHKQNVDEYSRYRGAATDGPREFVMQLGADEKSEKTLKRTDAMWARWAADPAATRLVVIANYPRAKRPGWRAERRLLILPLARDNYMDDNLRIEINGDGLTIETPPLDHAGNTGDHPAGNNR